MFITTVLFTWLLVVLFSVVQYDDSNKVPPWRALDHTRLMKARYFTIVFSEFRTINQPELVGLMKIFAELLQIQFLFMMLSPSGVWCVWLNDAPQRCSVYIETLLGTLVTSWGIQFIDATHLVMDMIMAQIAPWLILKLVLCSDIEYQSIMFGVFG